MTAGEVSINIYDHGVALDEKKQRVQCNYCGKVMSGFSRLKYHVGGIRGDVVPCEKVAVNVRESFRSMLLETKRASLDKEVQDPYHPDLPCKRFYSPDLNAAKRKKRDVNHTTGCGSGMHAEMHSVMEDDMTEHVSVNNRRTAMSSSGAKENVLSRQAQRCIGRFFYETGFDFSASTLPSFQRMINATLDDGQSEYKVPALQDLKGWILHDEVEEMKTYVKEISRSWASTGCSVLLDGWVDEKGRNLVSFVVECPGGPTYLRSADVSAIIDDVNALQMLLEGVIEEVGIGNVVQIVAFSTVGWVGAVGEQFMQRYWCVFWCVSASHCIELMLEKIGAMDSIRIALEKAKIITKFIYGHTEVLKLLRNHIDDYDLIKPSKMKLAMPFFTLENIVSEKKNLEEMFDSSEWKTSVWSSTVEGKRVADLVGDHSFWSGAEMASKATLDDYRHARGAFEEGKAIDKRTNISPAQWWCTYGKQCPELQRFAVRILSQTCDGASRYGLKRSMAEKILTDRRNPSDVISEEIDPLDDWVMDEAPPEVVPENGDRGLMDSECSEDTTNVEGHRGFQAKEEPIEDDA
ncbi:HAT TRANSPOSON SUPERFAMILY PROTEIN [Salix viminalis]|uniref:HAT TRANSPOSON SUPERFAMILY PROTEIN n=1 Tax=Salix viminalis TaxID=40686 RepID=A0A9Q0SIM8_SALVM|nr:HAT TRANSPOSON SUPERFAMILY PROTEIN [Salix viminalis]KAJ6678857.1 HAT TRANSPOSON SUPERFAMILY PROTEIN [Salix viminalis]